MKSARRKPLLLELRKRAYPQTCEMLSDKLGANVSMLLTSMRWSGLVVCRKFGAVRWYAYRRSQFDSRPYRVESRPNGVWVVEQFYPSEMGARQVASYWAEQGDYPYRVVRDSTVLHEWNIATEEQKRWLNAKRTLRQIRRHLRPRNSPTPESRPAGTSPA